MKSLLRTLGFRKQSNMSSGSSSTSTSSEDSSFSDSDITRREALFNILKQDMKEKYPEASERKIIRKTNREAQRRINRSILERNIGYWDEKYDPDVEEEEAYTKAGLARKPQYNATPRSMADFTEISNFLKHIEEPHHLSNLLLHPMPVQQPYQYYNVIHTAFDQRNMEDRRDATAIALYHIQAAILQQTLINRLGTKCMREGEWTFANILDTRAQTLFGTENNVRDYEKICTKFNETFTKLKTISQRIAPERVGIISYEEALAILKIRHSAFSNMSSWPQFLCSGDARFSVDVLHQKLGKARIENEEYHFHKDCMELVTTFMIYQDPKRFNGDLVMPTIMDISLVAMAEKRPLPPQVISFEVSPFNPRSNITIEDSLDSGYIPGTDNSSIQGTPYYRTYASDMVRDITLYGGIRLRATNDIQDPEITHSSMEAHWGSPCSCTNSDSQISPNHELWGEAEEDRANHNKSYKTSTPYSQPATPPNTCRFAHPTGARHKSTSSLAMENPPPYVTPPSLKKDSQYQIPTTSCNRNNSRSRNENCVLTTEVIEQVVEKALDRKCRQNKETRNDDFGRRSPESTYLIHNDRETRLTRNDLSEIFQENLHIFKNEASTNLEDQPSSTDKRVSFAKEQEEVETDEDISKEELEEIKLTLAQMRTQIDDSKSKKGKSRKAKKADKEILISDSDDEEELFDYNYAKPKKTRKSKRKGRFPGKYYDTEDEESSETSSNSEAEESAESGNEGGPTNPTDKASISRADKVYARITPFEIGADAQYFIKQIYHLAGQMYPTLDKKPNSRQMYTLMYDKLGPEVKQLVDSTRDVKPGYAPSMRRFLKKQVGQIKSPLADVQDTSQYKPEIETWSTTILKIESNVGKLKICPRDNKDPTMRAMFHTQCWQILYPLIPRDVREKLTARGALSDKKPAQIYPKIKAELIKMDNEAKLINAGNTIYRNEKKYINNADSDSEADLFNGNDLKTRKENRRVTFAMDENTDNKLNQIIGLISKRERNDSQNTNRKLNNEYRQNQGFRRPATPYSSRNTASTRRGQSVTRETRDIVCFKCQKKGHYANDCRSSNNQRRIDSADGRIPRFQNNNTQAGPRTNSYNSSAYNPGNRRRSPGCIACKGPNHQSDDCPTHILVQRQEPLSPSERKLWIDERFTCQWCKQQGHTIRTCKQYVIKRRDQLGDDQGVSISSNPTRQQ